MTAKCSTSPARAPASTRSSRIAEIGIAPVEADEQEAARAIEIVRDRAIAAVGERRLQILGRPHDRVGARRIAERLEDEAQLAVVLERLVIARRVDARHHAVLGERALERVVVRRGHDGAERQLAEEADGLGQLRERRRRLLQLVGEAIAEPAAHEAGGRERRDCRALVARRRRRRRATRRAACRPARESCARRRRRSAVSPRTGRNARTQAFDEIRDLRRRGRHRCQIYWHLRLLRLIGRAPIHETAVRHVHTPVRRTRMPVSHM